MRVAWEHPVGALGLGLVLYGQYLGLFDSPATIEMRDAVRILYVHVPAAWTAMACFLGASISAFAYLLSGRRALDWLLEACAEVGVVLGVLLTVLGMLFARPTWNVYWTWDARLTSTALMVLTFAGVVLLRSLVADEARRATWSSVVAILAAANLPITYLSVVWWRSVHQIPNTADSVSSPIRGVLLLNALAFGLIALWFVARRYRIARARALEAEPPPLSVEETP